MIYGSHGLIRSLDRQEGVVDALDLKRLRFGKGGESVGSVRVHKSLRSDEEITFSKRSVFDGIFFGGTAEDTEDLKLEGGSRFITGLICLALNRFVSLLSFFPFPSIVPFFSLLLSPR